jgi:hypothetical protein
MKLDETGEHLDTKTKKKKNETGEHLDMKTKIETGNHLNMKTKKINWRAFGYEN